MRLLGFLFLLPLLYTLDLLFNLCPCLCVFVSKLNSRPFCNSRCNILLLLAIVCQLAGTDNN